MEISELKSGHYYWVRYEYETKIVYIYGKIPFLKIDDWPTGESLNPLDIKKWISECVELDGRYDDF